MLHNAGIASPVVLVGHSIGAAFARLYAARYPPEVPGMVIGDHAGHYRIPGGMAAMRPEEETLQRLSPAAQDMHQWAASRSGASGSRIDNRFFDSCIAEATTRSRPHALGNKPLILIANENLAGAEDYRNFQRDLIALSQNSNAMISRTSGHGIPVENPAIFIRAIREVVTAARTNGVLE